jgi:hypothetical protein
MLAFGAEAARQDGVSEPADVAGGLSSSKPARAPHATGAPSAPWRVAQDTYQDQPVYDPSAPPYDPEQQSAPGGVEAAQPPPPGGEQDEPGGVEAQLPPDPNNPDSIQTARQPPPEFSGDGVLLGAGR